MYLEYKEPNFIESEKLSIVYNFSEFRKEF